MYAIRNIKTKEWVYGTDHQHNPPKQKTSKHKAKLFENEKEVMQQIIRRGISRVAGKPDEWEVVEVMLIEKPIITQDMIDEVEKITLNLLNRKYVEGETTTRAVPNRITFEEMSRAVDVAMKNMKKWGDLND